MARTPLSKERNSYLEELDSQHESNSLPRKYSCPHHQRDYYLRVPTLLDEERYGNEKKYPTPARQIAARVAILLVDADGNQLLKESDVDTLMNKKGFSRHAIDMLVAVGDTDPDQYTEEEIDQEKKESSQNQSIDSF